MEYNIIKFTIKTYRYLLKRYNRLKFRYKGVILGENMIALDHIYIRTDKTSHIKIGKNFVLSSGAGHNPLCRNIKASILVDKNAQLNIADNVGMSSPCIWVSKSITIGNNVLVGGGTILIDTDAHNLDYRIRLEKGDNFKVVSKPIIIEDNVFIGAYSIVLKGVTIGHGAVIGAGSVVTNDIPANYIAAGNPCRPIKPVI